MSRLKQGLGRHSSLVLVMGASGTARVQCSLPVWMSQHVQHCGPVGAMGRGCVHTSCHRAVQGVGGRHGGSHVLLGSLKLREHQQVLDRVNVSKVTERYMLNHFQQCSKIHKKLLLDVNRVPSTPRQVNLVWHHTGSS